MALKGQPGFLSPQPPSSQLHRDPDILFFYAMDVESYPTPPTFTETSTH